MAWGGIHWVNEKKKEDHHSYSRKHRNIVIGQHMRWYHAIYSVDEGDNTMAILKVVDGLYLILTISLLFKI